MNNRCIDADKPVVTPQLPAIMTVMKLLIASINHNDVLGRQRLIEWLKQKSDIESGLPEFVAVEWDNDIFSCVKAQRTLIGELVRKEWPSVSSSFVQAIQQSLAYEGDTHKDVFPSVKTIWLDSGREVTDETIVSQNYIDRMKIYKSFTRNTCLDFSDNMLMNMSLEAWRQAGSPPPEGTQRDIVFSNIIMSHIENIGSGWAIIIVGTIHGSLSPNSMVSLLSKQGCNCLPEELRPEHKQR